MVFSPLDVINQVLVSHGWQINTAFIERMQLSMRQYVTAVGRRVTTLYKGEDGLRQQLAMYHGDFCLPHISMRQVQLQHTPTKGTGSAKQ